MPRKNHPGNVNERRSMALCNIEARLKWTDQKLLTECSNKGHLTAEQLRLNLTKEATTLKNRIV